MALEALNGAGNVAEAPGHSAQATTREALFHVNDGHHLKLVAENTVNDPVGTFMHLAQAALDQLMDGMPSGRHSGRTFHAGNQTLDLQSRIVLRVMGDEVPNGL